MAAPDRQPPNAQVGSAVTAAPQPAVQAGADSTSAGGIPADEVIIAALVVILLAGLSPPAAVHYATPLMAALGLSADVIGLLVPHISLPPPGTPPGALHHAIRTSAARSAAYALNAARRAKTGTTLAQERRYLEQHLNGERQRRQSAVAVDAQARRTGPIVGWYAVLDDATTPECRAAHAKNFHYLAPPAIGYPGTLHGGTCRCKPGRPHRGADMLV